MAPSRGLLPHFAKKINCARCEHALRRQFTTSVSCCSGHNRWSKIRHDKGKNDAIKNRQRSHFAHELATSSKLFGADPRTNPKLADLITKAKKEGFAKASIEAAIARGQGRSATGAALENVTIEGILPDNIGVIVECETDSRLRTLMVVKGVLKEAGGSATPSAYLFEKRGKIVFQEREGVGVEEMLEAAIEAGAADVVEDEDTGGNIVFCDPTDTKSVGEMISGALKLDISTSDIIWYPNDDTRISLPSKDAAVTLSKFMDDLQERESSVSAVSMNISQGVLEDDSWRELQARVGA